MLSDDIFITSHFFDDLYINKCR